MDAAFWLLRTKTSWRMTSTSLPAHHEVEKIAEDFRLQWPAKKRKFEVFWHEDSHTLATRLTLLAMIKHWTPRDREAGRA